MSPTPGSGSGSKRTTDYDSYFVNTSQNIAAGLPRNTAPFTTMTMATGAISVWMASGQAIPTTLRYRVVRTAGSASWRTTAGAGRRCTQRARLLLRTEDLRFWLRLARSHVGRPGVRLARREDVQIPNDEEQHAARARRRFDPSSCPLNNPKSRKCYVTECIPPFLFRAATPGDKVCVTPERAQQMAADKPLPRRVRWVVRAGSRETAVGPPNRRMEADRRARQPGMVFRMCGVYSRRPGRRTAATLPSLPVLAEFPHFPFQSAQNGCRRGIPVSRRRAPRNLQVSGTRPRRLLRGPFLGVDVAPPSASRSSSFRISRARSRTRAFGCSRNRSNYGRSRRGT